MELRSLMVLRPICFFIILAVPMFLLSGFVLPFWIIKAKSIEQQVKSIPPNCPGEIPSEMENVAKLLLPFNSSAAVLASALGSFLNETELSFSMVETMVAPVLFRASSTVPHLSQISYIGFDGLFFSYYSSGNQFFALYSNSSVMPNGKTKYTWYTQPVDRETGKLLGQAVDSHAQLTVNASWIQEALNSTNGYSSIGAVWNNDEVTLFNIVAGVGGKGAVSVGLPLKTLAGFFSGINLHGGSLYLATKDGKVLIDGIPNTHVVVVNNSVSFQLLRPDGDRIGRVGNVTCEPYHGKFRASALTIWDEKHTFFCSPIEIIGLESVYVLALPHCELASIVHKNVRITFLLLVTIIFTMVTSVVIFMLLILRAARREMQLCAALIKEMESTQQAERKSMNKSLAFASASHDVRASLAAISGLIEVCHDEVDPGSELETNLMQMEVCINDLLGILNSILDTSKIEAGKMQLEEEEFDIAQLLEDVVDLYYPVGIKKGIDVMLDSCDGSVSKFSLVKGDRGKLKQILCNLLSNAVKFTSEGHVSVRAWVKKPSFKNSIFASNQHSSLNCLSCLIFKNDERYNEGLEGMNTIRKNPNCMEFVIEVDDTGRGIPKEKQKSVFENYVQVKETALGQGGTGLGLGIVQSLVRLMGGEIRIVDKQIGEKGTCFRFNAFLTICRVNSSGHTREEDAEFTSDHISSDWHQPPWLSNHTPSPKLEASQVILLIQSHERQRISQKFMESLGIKVSAVEQWQQFPRTLKRIKHKVNFSQCSSSGRSDLSFRSDCVSRSASRNSRARAKDLPLSSLDGTDNIIPPPQTRTNPKGHVPNFMLVVIDTNAGPFRELGKAVAEFRKDLCNTCCRVVWIDKPGAHNIHSKGLNESSLPPTDLIMSKPFHGSRLYQLIGLLPEFGGSLPGNSPKTRTQNKYQVEKASSESNCPESQACTRSKSRNSQKHHLSMQRREIQEHGSISIKKPSSGKKFVFAGHNPSIQLGEVQGDGSMRNEKPSSGKWVLLATHNLPSQEGKIREQGGTSTSSEKRVLTGKRVLFAAHDLPVQRREIQEHGGTSVEKPLSGKKVLVVEDNDVLRKLAVSNISHLGATVEVSENGEEAVELVCKGLSDQSKSRASGALPYDYIFMDCEMPVMDGVEATRRIREEETYYGVHMPIIALTAHTTGEEADRMIQAGMDFHLAKPFKKEQLLEAITYLHSK